MSKWDAGEEMGGANQVRGMRGKQDLTQRNKFLCISLHYTECCKITLLCVQLMTFKGFFFFFFYIFSYCASALHVLWSKLVHVRLVTIQQHLMSLIQTCIYITFNNKDVHLGHCFHCVHSELLSPWTALCTALEKSVHFNTTVFAAATWTNALTF